MRPDNAKFVTAETLDTLALRLQRAGRVTTFGHQPNYEFAMDFFKVWLEVLLRMFLLK